jgi:hypothetical protein
MYPGETEINCRCSQEISFSDTNPDEAGDEPIDEEIGNEED